MDCPNRYNRGFTLLELMVAFTIMALMAGMVFSSLRLAMNSYDHSQERIEEEAVKRILLDHVKRQIGSLYPLRPSMQSLNEVLGRQSGLNPLAPPDLSSPQAPFGRAGLNRMPLFTGERQSVTFISVVSLILQRNPGLTVVRYGLASDEYGETYLGLMEARYTGYESFLQMAGSPQGKPLPIVENIRELKVDYYGLDPQAQVFDWFETWLGEQLFAVPVAVRISWENGHIVVPINASAFPSSRRRPTRRVIPSVGNIG